MFSDREPAEKIYFLILHPNFNPKINQARKMAPMENSVSPNILIHQYLAGLRDNHFWYRWLLPVDLPPEK
jgi:hypothetical protein